VLKRHLLPKTPTRILLFVALALVTGLALRAALWRPFDVIGQGRNDGLFHVSGAIHVHTTASDGSGSPDDILTAARTAGIDFMAITDHNNLDAKPYQGYRDGVLTIVGAELSTNAGHMLALGIPDPGFQFSGDVGDSLDDVRHLGGVAFAAHPWSPRQDLSWTGWDLPGAWGVELMNLDSAWRLAGWTRLARAAIFYPINNRYAWLAALDTPGERLSDWDTLLAERDVPGIVGTDAHGHVDIVEGLSLPFPDYESLLSFAKNHILLDAPLTGTPATDASKIVEALRRGASYVAVDALAPADGFSFTVESDDGRFTMGDTAPLASSHRLMAGGRLPERTTLTLFRDGLPIAEREASLVLPTPGPGVYRVEARLPGWKLPWIISNPIYVFGDATRNARAARARWPQVPPPPAPVQILDSFEGQTIFQAGFDASSWMNEDILAPTEGADGHGAGRMEFRLGTQDSRQSDSSCELANREQRDLTGRHGLVFSIKGDAEYRVWVQVRDDNPVLTESVESWSASARTSEGWRRVAIPFTAFRSTNPATDGTLDLDQVRALVFVVDRGAAKIGTSGTIWIDDVGVY
jgi:hypothetical protein